MILNHPTGIEVGGFGVFENGGVGLGVDWANGREAVSIFGWRGAGVERQGREGACAASGDGAVILS